MASIPQVFVLILSNGVGLGVIYLDILEVKSLES
jgi:hypothetical protein